MILIALAAVWAAAALDGRLTIGLLLSGAVVVAVTVVVEWGIRRYASRKVAYCLAHQVRSMILWPFNRLVVWIMSRWNGGTYGRVRFVDYTGSGGEEAEFAGISRSALEFLSAYAPQRYNRLIPEIDFVVNSRLKAASAAYSRSLRTVWVDFRKLCTTFTDDAGDALICWYAGVLVHEATHGRLHRMRYPYTRVTRDRIERLCTREARRFLDALPEQQFPWLPELKAHLSSSN